MQNDHLSLREEARRQAAENYIPSQPNIQQERVNFGAINTFAEDYFINMDQIPGNSQEMHVSPSPRGPAPSTQTKSQVQAYASDFQIIHDDEDLDYQQKQFTRPATSTPMLDFRSNQIENQESSHAQTLNKAIEKDRRAFKKMQLLQPRGSLVGSENSKTMTISKDQERMKIESKIQKLKQAQAQIMQSNSDYKQDLVQRPASAAASFFGNASSFENEE